MAVRNESDPIEGSFHYEGRGYDNPHSADSLKCSFPCAVNCAKRVRRLVERKSATRGVVHYDAL